MDNNVKFYELCKVFTATVQSKAKDKSNALTSFIADFKQKAQELKTLDSNTSVSFYPFLRLILPHLERERSPYGLKEYSLGKKLIKMLFLPNEGHDAKCLNNFRTSHNSNVRDFADAAYWVLKKHFLAGDKLNIAEVNSYLDALAERHAENDPRGLESKLYELFQNTSAEEQKWLIRIILKDLRMGVGQDRILKLYHPDAVDLYSTNNSLAKVCETLFDSTVRLHEIEISIFTPFMPMLSQRCDKVQFNKVFLGDRKFCIENKFDGERFQIHMENGQFKYYSRNGFDYTNTYGSSFSSGLYTPLLRHAFKSSVKRIILDGEMMGWNTSTRSFGSKGMDFDVKHLKSDSKHQPCFCVFDILLYNDSVLTNKPLKERSSLLNELVSPKGGVIVLSKRTEATSKQEILNALNDATDRKEEGIVFKDLESFYKSNDRNAGWWKVKLEFFDDVMSDLDVLVMGGYYGEGRNRQRVAGFLVGVAVPPGDGGSLPSAYWSLAKIASGLSNEELDVVEENLGPHWKKLSEGNPLDYGLHWGKEKPDVWIPPSQSCVLLVRASELIKIHSLDFKTNYTLRFPRILKIRLDKPYYDCLTTLELNTLTASSKSVEKLNKRHLELSDLELPAREKKSRKRHLNVEQQPVEQLSTLLDGYQFCVLTGNEALKKTEVEVLIREHGGTVVQHEGPQTLCMIVGDDHPRVKTCINQDAPYDLVKLKWLADVLDSKVFKLYSLRDMLHTSKITKERFLSEYDKYGDSFIQETDLESLKHTLEVVKDRGGCMYPTLGEVEALNKELATKSLLNVFNNTTAYFDENDALDVEQMDFQFLGGTVASTFQAELQLVVTNTRQRFFACKLEEMGNTTAPIVSGRFINDKIRDIKSLLL